VTEILRADSIAKRFRGRNVLTSATLRAYAGQLRVLFGRNGSGKSTLLRIAAGWLRADFGAVRFGGKVYQHARAHELGAAGLMYWPDRGLFSNAFTIQQQLEMIRERFGGPEILECTTRTGVEKLIGRRPHALSEGELRRAELAAVLVRSPSCILADEPYRGIAPLDAERLTSLLRELAEAGKAVVMTGHEAPTLLDAADHVSWCTSGTTHDLGPPSVARQNDAFRRDYLGTWN
jgi:lipopolysaccharide export system ATP-binding protein